MIQIIKAEYLGMCFGVRDAIALAEKTARQQPLTIVGDLVHNPVVVERLKKQGVRIEHDPERITTPHAMITAHGASEKRIAAIKARGLSVLESTCPLVHSAHRAVAQLVAEGFYPVVIGKRDHVEVRGLTEDLAECTVVETEEGIAEIPERPRIGVAAQTTQPIERVLRWVGLIKARFPRAEVRFADTVCLPTKQRQRAALDLAERCDVVIVVGGAHSNNTRELVRTCGSRGARVHHIQGPGDLQPEWLEGASTVGLTAGTSTPEDLIADVEAALRALAGIKARELPSLAGVE